MRRSALLVSSLLFIGCKSEAPSPSDPGDANAATELAAPAPQDTSSSDASPPSASASAADTREASAGIALTTPEEAVAVFINATRASDIDSLWAVMPAAARAALPEVMRRASQASDAELAKAGLTRDALATLTPRDFFAKVVKATPSDPLRFPTAPSELKASYEEPGRTRASVRFKTGSQICQASTLFEEGVWRVEQAGCDNP